MTNVLAFFDNFIATAELFGNEHDVPGEMPGVTSATEARSAVAQLIEDNRAALRILESDGLGDSPLAGFLRAALARVGGAA